MQQLRRTPRSVLVTPSCLTLSDPMDCSPPGSSVRGILQARTGLGCHSLLQGIFPSQGLNLGLRHCRRTLYPSKPPEFLKKLKMETPYDPAIPLLGIYPEKTLIQKDTCTPMFIAALFIIIKTWKQTKCLLTDEWIKKI